MASSMAVHMLANCRRIYFHTFLAFPWRIAITTGIRNPTSVTDSATVDAGFIHAFKASGVSTCKTNNLWIVSSSAFSFQNGETKWRSPAYSLSSMRLSHSKDAIISLTRQILFVVQIQGWKLYMTSYSSPGIANAVLLFWRPLTPVFAAQTRGCLFHWDMDSVPLREIFKLLYCLLKYITKSKT